MECRICSSKTKNLFFKNLLGKYKVNYYQCKKCKFLQTEEPYWLDEAYSSGAISAFDTGIISRNLLLRRKTTNILLKLFNDFLDFRALDYGGGEGIFTRMMRDLGYNFYRYDLYADNLYARFFDLKDIPKGTRFDILTAFEVFEHLVEPLDEIKRMLNFSDVLLFSTELQPSEEKKELEDWWYVAPETGQHVSFYNVTSLEKIADILGLNLYTDRVSLHILSKNELKNPFIKNEDISIKPNLARRIIKRLYNRLNKIEDKHSYTQLPPSLTLKDFEFVKRKLNNQENKSK